MSAGSELTHAEIQCINKASEDALPDHLKQQLNTLRDKPALKHFLVDLPFPHKEISVTKFRSPVQLPPVVNGRDELSVPGKKIACLVATGQAFPHGALIYVKRDPSAAPRYSFFVWNMDIHNTATPVARLTAVKRVTLYPNGMTLEEYRHSQKSATTKRKRESRDALELDDVYEEQFEPRIAKHTDMGRSSRRRTIPSFRESSTPPQSPSSERPSITPEDGIVHVNDNNNTCAHHRPLLSLDQANETVSMAENPTNPESARRINALAPAQSHISPASVISLGSDHDEDDTVVTATISDETKLKATVVRFLSNDNKIKGSVRLCRTPNLDKFIAQAAAKFNLPRDEKKPIVTGVTINGGEALGIIEGEDEEFKDFMAAVMGDACWLVKPEDAELQEKDVCVVEVRKL